MKKATALVLTLCMCLLMFAGCGSNDNAATSQASSSSAESSAASESATGTRTVTDMGGREVTIEGEVKSIVNLWPSYTTTLYVLGAGDLVSAVGTNSTVNSWTEFFYPRSAEIQALGGTTPNVEEIAALDPDLVILHPSSVQAGYDKQLEELGIPALNVNFDSYETMIESLNVLGQAVGGDVQKKVDKLTKTISDKLENNRKLTADLSDEDKPVVYYISGINDSLTGTMAGEDTFQESWVEANGGIYAGAQLEVGEDAEEVVAEDVLALNPDVIMIGNVYQHKLMEELQNTPGWQDLDAVKNGRVYTIPLGCWGWDRFGAESAMMLDYALYCIQPKIAEENNITRDTLIEETIDFYKTYNGTELTKEQAGYLLDGLSPTGGDLLEEREGQQ